LVQRLVALLVLTVIVEVAVISEVAQRIGTLNTVGLLILVSAVGAFVVKVQGLAMLRRVLADLARDQVPGAALADGALLAAAGVLVLIPGFVTDVVGLLLLVPPVRAGVRRTLRRRWSKRIVGSSYEIEA
jgi:UPF0716 protein FxsA